MKRIATLTALALSLTFLIAAGCTPRESVLASNAHRPINLLVVTGGHGFKAQPFTKLVTDIPDVAATFVAQTRPAEVYDRPDLLSYDAVLLYDAQYNINDRQKAAFLSLFQRGIGVVVLHHALLSYQKWPEYERIAGGKYLLDVEHNADGTTSPESTYQEGQDLPVTVVDTHHPVTAGMSDFVIRDEIYRGVRMRPDITPLLTAEGRPLAWARTEKNSRVVAIIIGHGPAYTDANFQRLLSQSVQWVAKRR